MDGHGSAKNGSRKSFNVDADAQRLPLFSAKDTLKIFAKEPEKYGQVAPPVKNHDTFVVFQPQIMTNVHKENDPPPPAPMVEPCYHQINWPQAVLQRWATEKADREKNFNLVFK